LLDVSFAADVAAGPPPPPPRPSALPTVVASDISEQSMMRDGRPVDAILNGKAQFKGVAAATGEVATEGGAALLTQGVLSNNTDMAGLGAGIAIFGLLASAASDAATPAADTRYWDTLPGRLDLATFKWPAGKEGIQALVDGFTFDIYTPKGAVCSVGWVHPADVLASPSAPNSDPARELDSRRLAQDARFRAMLLTDFATPLSEPEPPTPAPGPQVVAGQAAPVPQPQTPAAQTTAPTPILAAAPQLPTGEAAAAPQGLK